jgi:hypothetical protein
VRKLVRLLLPVTFISVVIATAAPALAYPLIPQPGTPCLSATGGAAAGRPGGGFMQCTGGQWSPIGDVAAHGDRWLTYGPMLQLRGPAEPNPQLAEGDWVADPQDTSTRCSILQTVLVHPPDQTVPQLATGKAGEQLKFQIQQRTLTGQVSGNCLWRRQL